MKRYLLIAGYDYYPGAGTTDWVDSFDSYEEALNVVEPIQENGGGRRGYTIRDMPCDWYEIVDLTEWSPRNSISTY
jgi:hypothetical protein